MAAPRYHLRLARDPAELSAALALRARLFRARVAAGAGGAGAGAGDEDAHDARCEHVLIEAGGPGGALAGCFRLRLLAPKALAGCYSAQFYDLAPLANGAAPLLELGRFCLAPGRLDADILRLAWGALARRVARSGAVTIFGCSSFAGADAAAHGAALAWLGARHRAPAGAGVRARPGVASLALPRTVPDVARTPAPRTLPPLLRSYLGLGGQVSEDAVLDPALDTLHVLTSLPVRAIPPARRASLERAAAQEAAFGPGL